MCVRACVCAPVCVCVCVCVHIFLFQQFALLLSDWMNSHGFSKELVT
jgi:hypothetical protein